MSITKVIKKVVAPRLKEYQFEYKGKEGGLIWVFKREKGIEQYIELQKSNYSKEIGIRIATSINNIGIGGHLLSKEIEYFEEYTDEESLKVVLNKLVDVVTTEKAFKQLELLSVPEEQATKEMKKELLVNPEQRAKLFAEDYHLDMEETRISLKKLEQILKKIGGNTVFENREVLINAAAFMGEVIIRCLGGEWKWNEIIESSRVIKIGCNEESSSPLVSVCLYWQKPDRITYGIVEEYDQIVRRINLRNGR